MSAATDANKKHRLRSKNEVVQLNDFFEELNEEYEQELKMRQNNGSAVDETALLGDREIPFQFVDDEDDSEDDADDSGDESGSVASETEAVAPEAQSDTPAGRSRSRGDSGGAKKLTGSSSATPNGVSKSDKTAKAEPAQEQSAAATSAGSAPATPAKSAEEKTDAVTMVQRSTSFVGNQGNRPSVVNKLRSFWEKLGDEPTGAPSGGAAKGPVLSRTTSVSAYISTSSSVSSTPVTEKPAVTPTATTASPASPAASPSPAPAAASAPAPAGGVKKWAPVVARPALAMAISVPGDRSTVAKEAPIVRAMSVVGLPNTAHAARNVSPSPGRPASTSVSGGSTPQKPAAPADKQVSPRAEKPVGTKLSPRDRTPTPADKQVSPRAEKPVSPRTEPAKQPEPTAATVVLAGSTENVSSGSSDSLPAPTSEAEVSKPVSESAGTPASTPAPVEPQPEPKATEAVAETLADPVTEPTQRQEQPKDAVEPSSPKTPPSSSDESAQANGKEQTPSEPKPVVEPSSPTKSRRGTKGSAEKATAAAATYSNSGSNSPTTSDGPERKKKRTSEKRRRNGSEADAAAENSDSGSSVTKKKRTKTRGTNDVGTDDESQSSTPNGVPEPSTSAATPTTTEIKTKKRRKKLTATQPGGTPTKRVSTKKIKKSSSVASDAPPGAGKTAEKPVEDPNAAAREQALASAGVAPKEIDKLKQFFQTWHGRTLMHTWEIDPSEIEFVERIGEGTSCSVYRGTYRGQEVALKVLKDINQKQLTNFTKEFDIISQFRSPYVVFFFGACIEPIPVMVLGYCRKGSLFHVLNNPNENITWDLILKVSLQTLRGLDSLHNWKPQIVHRDLKSRNILVEDDWNTKLCDFGESRYTQGANLETLCKVRGTYAYIAPEVYFGQSFTTKSDVYAFGVILWELCNRLVKGRYESPFSEYKSLIYDFQIIVQASRKGLRPTIDPKVPQALQNVIRCCWDHEPENRPDTSSLLHFFEDIIAEPNQKKWLDVKHAVAYPPAKGVGAAGAPPKSGTTEK